MGNKKDFKKSIIKRLTEDKDNESYLIEQISELSVKGDDKKGFYSQLLELFVHLEFSEQEAKEHWTRIFENCDYLSMKLGRNVGIRVSMFDYFCNINKLLVNPMLIEIHLFKQTEKMAMVDGLTGLFNRRYFEIALRNEVERSKRYSKEFSLMMIDIDDFKHINDSHGHIQGDIVLKSFSKFLMSNVRTEDIVSRYGGEEFVIILPETTGNGAVNFGARLLNKIRDNKLLVEHKLSFSGGIAHFPYDGINPRELLKTADKLLYQAKFSGKNRVIKSTRERRSFPRYQITWKVDFKKIVDGFESDEAFHSYTQDISLGGLRFESKKKLSLDTGLIVKIYLTDEDSAYKRDKVIVSCDISWIQKLDNGRYLYGLKFRDLSQKDKKFISKHIPVSEKQRVFKPYDY